MPTDGGKEPETLSCARRIVCAAKVFGPCRLGRFCEHIVFLLLFAPNTICAMPSHSQASECVRVFPILYVAVLTLRTSVPVPLSSEFIKKLWQSLVNPDTTKGLVCPGALYFDLVLSASDIAAMRTRLNAWLTEQRSHRKIINGSNAEESFKEFLSSAEDGAGRKDT